MLRSILASTRTAPTLLLAATLTFGLAACDKKSSDSAAVSPPAAEPAKSTDSKKSDAAGNAPQQATAKMDAYTDAYNKLIGTFGLFETHQSYLKEDIAKKKPSDSISITDGWVELALAQFQKTRALPGTAPGELDASAERLIGALDKLVVQLKALDVYYESKAYREDNLAKGKAQDAELRANFDASIAATNQFSSALNQEEKKASAAVLARLKALGDMLGYTSKLALGQAGSIIELFDDEKDIKNVEKYKQADALIAELDKTLAEQRQHFAAAKAKNLNPDSDYESLASNLVSLIGDYRDFKQSKDPRYLNSAVKNYNDAVKSSNDIN